MYLLVLPFSPAVGQYKYFVRSTNFLIQHGHVFVLLISEVGILILIFNIVFLSHLGDSHRPRFYISTANILFEAAYAEMKGWVAILVFGRIFVLEIYQVDAA